MVAATGFQRQGYDKNELVSRFKDVLKSPNKFFEFTRKSLRGAKDIFNKGGHVTTVLKEQLFRMIHDSRREIIEPSCFSKTHYNLSEVLLDSKPLRDINHCRTMRFISKFPLTIPFNKNNTNRAKTLYKTNIEVGVRNFIKAYYSMNERFGLNGNEFRFASNLIDFIKGFEPAKNVKVSRNSISKLKNRNLF